MADLTEFRAAMITALGPNLPHPDDDQAAAMFTYYLAVVETNRQFNLTRIVEPTEAAAKHFADAIALLGWADQLKPHNPRVLDVGTGAGFPAVPLAIMRPDWRITAVDSTAKKVRFVAATVAEMGLRNITTEHRRAGEWKPSEFFDLVTHKAVGNLRRCVEQSANLVKPGGHLVVYKTARPPAAERSDGTRAAQRHHLVTDKPYEYTLILGDEALQRSLWIFRNR